MRAETLGRSGALGALLLLMLSAPALATTANDLCAANADPCVVATPVPVTTNSIIDVGSRELRINAGGALDVGGGTMTVRAGRLTVNSGGFIRASGSTSVPGGTIFIEAGPVTIAGSVDARGTPGGTITLTSSGAVAIGGTTSAPGLGARSLSLSEIGGTITVSAESVNFTGVITVLGGSDALGGDVTITTTGSQVISGSIDATGGDGGSIDIEAGVLPGSADVTITSTASLRVDATLGGGFGGTLDVSASGDGVEHGNIFADGALSATGKAGSEDTGGGAGGCITLTAAGDVVNTSPLGALSAAGGGPDGDGGEIEISANGGGVQIAGSADVGSTGAESSGGSIAVDAALDVMLNGKLAAAAGDGGGGEVDISSAGTIAVSRNATIAVDSNVTGSGGAIVLDSSFGSDLPHAVVVEGTLSASGGDEGGSIELSGGDSVRTSGTARLRADGNLGTGPGGTITVDVSGGPALLDAPMSLLGGGPSGAGGTVAIDASQRIVLSGAIDARGFGDGGRVGLSSAGAVDVRGAVLVTSTTAGGGVVEINSEGDVMIAASLTADGVASPGASIDITGCAVIICDNDSPACPSGGRGLLSSRGPEGRNRLTGRSSTIVLGTMRADVQTGHNVVRYDGDPEREPFLIGIVTPPPEVLVSQDILPCPACGNGNTEPPETCDDGNQLDGDGCSATCQVEAPIPGDANGDFAVTSADRDAAVAEIFDGDGDTVGTVSGGTYPGSIGADANDDGFVTAADLVAIGRLVAP